MSEKKLMVKELGTLKISEEKKKLVTLKSSDQQEFVVEESIILQSDMIKNTIEDCELDSINLPNVDGKTLGKVIEYFHKHASQNGDLGKFDEEFLDVGQAVLFDLIMAANYLSVRGLVDKICRKVASMMKGKSPEEIREIFEIENDFEPEQEKEIRAENAWAYENYCGSGSGGGGSGGASGSGGAKGSGGASGSGCASGSGGASGSV